MRPSEYFKKLKDNPPIATDESSYTIQSPVMTDPITNPCIKEQNLSTKCMHLSHYNKEECKEAFMNFKDCKKFWTAVEHQRFLNGEKPYLPLPEDRPRIQQQYVNKIKREFGVES